MVGESLCQEAIHLVETFPQTLRVVRVRERELGLDTEGFKSDKDCQRTNLFEETEGKCLYKFV